MFEHKVKAGETVIRQGDDGDYFYVVEEGVYHALINCDDGSMKKVTTISHHRRARMIKWMFWGEKIRMFWFTSAGLTVAAANRKGLPKKSGN